MAEGKVEAQSDREGLSAAQTDLVMGGRAVARRSRMQSAGEDPAVRRVSGAMHGIGWSRTGWRWLG